MFLYWASTVRAPGTNSTSSDSERQWASFVSPLLFTVNPMPRFPIRKIEGVVCEFVSKTKEIDGVERKKILFFVDSSDSVVSKRRFLLDEISVKRGVFETSSGIYIIESIHACSLLRWNCKYLGRNKMKCLYYNIIFILYCIIFALRCGHEIVLNWPDDIVIAFSSNRRTWLINLKCN